MKVKLFGKTNAKKDGSSMLELEAEINAWLTENPAIEICDIKQSSCGGSFQVSKTFITIWYREAATG